MSDTNEANILELPPEDLIKLIKKEKDVPAVMNVIAIPHNINELDEKEDMKLLVTFISLYSTILVHNKMPNWGLNDKDIITFLEAKAESYSNVIEGSVISNILHKIGSVDMTNTQFILHNVKFSPFHPEFLRMCYSGFPQSVMDQMKIIFGSASDKFDKLNINWFGSNRIITSYICYYFTDNSGKLRLRTFHTRIRNLQKTSDGFKLFIDLFDRIYIIDSIKMNENRKFINDSIDKLTKDARKEIEDLCAPEKVNV